MTQWTVQLFRRASNPYTKRMYTFRFNPVFNQWVLLGEQMPQALALLPAHTLMRQGDFLVASYPRQPFLLDPPTQKKHHAQDLAYAAQPAVGEYEIIVYTGKKELWQWVAEEWEAWTLVVAERLRQLHLNPHLHFVSLNLHTSALNTLGDATQRVGDLVATSHPLAGMEPQMTQDLLVKLVEKEKLFVVQHKKHGALYVPSAPTQHQEVWYLPVDAQGGFEDTPAAGRKTVAEALAALMTTLHTEFPTEQYIIRLHTAMAGMGKEMSWWLQIFQENHTEGALVVHRNPEHLVYLLRQRL